MKLRFLIKSADSRDEKDCPAVYAAEDPATTVCQGLQLDADTFAQLRNIGAVETGLSMPTETLLRAAALILVDGDYSDVTDQVEAFLAAQPWRVGR